jgi:hypothetical protein
MRVLERSSLEAYLFALVGIAAAAFPMTWYFRAFLVLVLAGIIVDLIIRSPPYGYLALAAKAVLQCCRSMLARSRRVATNL